MNGRKAIGVIALDIDGTITVHHHHLDESVKKSLLQMIDEGWEVIFLTGRTLSFARPILESIPASFLVAVQNGAAVYFFPDLRLKEEHVLERSLVFQIAEILDKEKVGFVIETQDRAYYVLDYFPKEEREYFEFRRGISPEKWTSLSHLNELPGDAFHVLKYFAKQGQVDSISKKLLSHFEHQIAVIPIRDPFRENGYLAHVTNRLATKGGALKRLIEEHKLTGPLVVAGDDYNDLEMLQMADFKIVMETAPKEVLAVGDMIAKAAEKNGIIEALQKAREYGRDYSH